MLVPFIYEQYGLLCEQDESNRSSGLLYGNDSLFLFLKNHFYLQDMRALAGLTHSLRLQGEEDIAMMIPDLRGEYVTTFQGVPVVLLSVSNDSRKNVQMPEELAGFHNRSTLAAAEQAEHSSYMNGTTYWAKRIDDLRNQYYQSLRQEQLSPFKARFMSVFPYFSGLAENAIQYMTDLRIDKGLIEPPAVCHYRFSNETWGRSGKRVKNPADWVIDHPSRDLAEWLRRSVWNGQIQTEQQLIDFLNQYHQEREITSHTKAMIYGRLLFPIPFIEIAEEYFALDGERDEEQWCGKLEACISRTESYVAFLRWYSDRVFHDVKVVDWLS
ncbi:spore coat protein YutH [Scopulibacillus darangshiensis]|uniref:Spore coat protein YutH n=1 Tax=Scopulibacillus darangshiensis TaxID=442528 RepID=A0A4R2NWN2_9BACL|nr:spore coat protein YutH [Scopulibacillus darangshiensis]TCP26573.1 spore coat protein YutH [Scopulibacillus darangshiensis]